MTLAFSHPRTALIISRQAAAPCELKAARTSGGASIRRQTATPAIAPRTLLLILISRLKQGQLTRLDMKKHVVISPDDGASPRA
jgi:hypothetical protein